MPRSRSVLIERGVQHWERFWHPEGYTLGLGLFRLFFAACLFSEVSTTRAKSLFAIAGGFHLPYPYVPAWIHPVSEHAFHLAQMAQYPFIALLAIGVLMRPAIIGLLALQGYVFCSDAMNFRNHPYFFLLALLLLLFSPADESVSFKSVWRIYRYHQPVIATLIGPTRSLTFQRLIMAQVCLIYFLGGLQKMNPGFLDGSVLEWVAALSVPTWGGQLPAIIGPEIAAHFQALLVHPKILMAMSIATFAMELVLPFTLWFRHTRTPSLIIGIGFHLAISFLMNIDQFSASMISSYLLFLEPETLPAFVTKLFRRKKLLT
jgi:HTTM domain